MLQLASGMGRLGTESAFEVHARATALEAQGKSIISLSIGQPDFQPPGHIVEAAIKFTGARPVPLPLLEENGFGFKAEDVLSRITPKTRLIIINSPANPTGGICVKAEIDKLVAGLEKLPDVAIMSDEIYSEMLYDGNVHTSLLKYPQLADRLIVLAGWSKTYAMTGWRMGYSVWPKHLIEHATRLSINVHSCVNAAAQYAGIAA